MGWNGKKIFKYLLHAFPKPSVVQLVPTKLGSWLCLGCDSGCNIAVCRLRRLPQLQVINQATAPPPPADVHSLQLPKAISMTRNGRHLPPRLLDSGCSH